MHGAIISDAFRIPWIPVKCFPFIDEFKWLDFTSSMNIKDFEFNFLPKIHDKYFFSDVIARKLGSKLIGDFLAPFVFRYRKWIFKKRLVQISLNAKKYNSDNELLNSKIIQLKQKMEFIKNKYFHE